MMRRAARALVLLVMLTACGGEPDGPDAGDSGADGGDAGAFVTPPDIPWLDAGVPSIAPPMLTPCPEGWQEVPPDTERGTTTCHPYAGERDACPAGSEHFVGEAGCTPTSAPCPAGVFPEGLPADVEVLYVLSSAPAGGDGSEGSPHATITAAIDAASPGAVIAVGKGTYDEAVLVSEGITLFGACALETRLTPSSPAAWARGVISVPSADVRLINLGIGPADLPGVVVFGTRASASIDGLIIEGVQKFGLFADAGARVQGLGLSISGTRPNRAGSFGRGIEVEEGSIVDLTRLRIFDNPELGVFAMDRGSSVTLSDVAIEDTGRWGLGVQSEGAMVINRGLISGNREVGVAANNPGTSLTLSDVVVEGTRGRLGDGPGGRALNVQTGATATVTRTLLSRNRSLGIYASEEGTSVMLSDVVVEHTLAQESNGDGGRGLNVESGAAIEINRALFSENRDVDAYVSGEGTSVMFSDVVMERTLAQESDGNGGRSLAVQQAATVVLNRAHIVETREIALFASGVGVSMTLADVVVEHTQNRESDGLRGRALNVQLGATAEVDRALFADNRDIGVLALGSGTSVRLTDVVVARTDEQACGRTTCADRPFGIGLAGMFEASLSATRFDVTDSALCGVMVANDGEVDLVEGRVSGSPIGVCLQVDGYPVSRLTESVHYQGNGTNLDTTSLPVPEAESLARPVE